MCLLVLQYWDLKEDKEEQNWGEIYSKNILKHLHSQKGNMKNSFIVVLMNRMVCVALSTPKVWL